MPRFVELEAARALPGLRLVVLGRFPSLWSEAAKAVFHVKGIALAAVRARPNDDAVRAWTGVHNVPVALYGDEPPRSGWADILALAERLSPAPPLLPTETQSRARLLGLCHQICGELGLMWSARLLLIHLSLTTGGKRGFSLAGAQYLADKYEYAAPEIPQARRRVLDILGSLADLLEAHRAEGSPYIFGNELTALDIYTAAATAVLVPFPDDLCPLLPQVRAILSCFEAELDVAVPPVLLGHRDLVYRRHLELPIAL